MRATFEHRIEKADYISGVAALVAEIGRSDPNRRRSNAEQIGMVVAALVIVTILFPKDGPGLLVFSITILTLSVIFAGRWLRLSRSASYDPAAMTVRVEIDDHGLREWSAVRDRRWTWDAVGAVHDGNGPVIIRLAAWDMIVLPASSWHTPEARSAFLVEVGQRLRGNAQLVAARVSADPETSQFWTVAALFAGADAAFGLSMIVPLYTYQYGPMMEDFGFAGAMALLIALSLVLGYFAFRVTRSIMPVIHAKSPAAATALTLLLILPVPIWMLVGYLM